MVVKISVFGLGFVGTVTAACLAERGHAVVGIDVDPAKVAMLSRGLSPVLEPEVAELLQSSARAGLLSATMDLDAAVAGSEISLICVGVGSDTHHAQDTDGLEALVREIAAAIARKGSFHSVVVGSTVLPGTTRGRILPVLEQVLGPIGTRFGLAHHPEFMREGTAVADFRNAPRAIIGELDTRTADALAALYGAFSRSLFRIPPERAEAVKYAENAWHALKVAFANEIGTICNADGIDGHAVMELLCADDRLNLSAAYLTPGFGFGGACLPKDVATLVRWGEKAGLDLPLLSHIDPSNRRHLQRSVDWLLASGRQRFAMLGLAYKTGTDDLRASPFLHIARALRAAKRDVRVFDLNVSAGRKNPSHEDYVGKVAGELDTLLTDDLPALAAWADAIVICSYAGDDREIFSLIGPHHVVLDFARIAAVDARPHAYHAFV